MDFGDCSLIFLNPESNHYRVKYHNKPLMFTSRRKSFCWPFAFIRRQWRAPLSFSNFTFDIESLTSSVWLLREESMYLPFWDLHGLFSALYRISLIWVLEQERISFFVFSSVHVRLGSGDPSMLKSIRASLFSSNHFAPFVFLTSGVCRSIRIAINSVAGIQSDQPN